MKKVILSFLLLLSGMTMMAQSAGLLQAGAAAPDFSLKAPDGSDFGLSRAGNAYKVLTFWASTDANSRRDMPILKLLCNKYSMNGVVFAGISFDKNADSWTKYYADTIKMNHMIELRDEAGLAGSQVAKSYQVTSLPTFYLIDKTNKVVMSANEVNALLYKLDELDRSGSFATDAFQEADQMPQFRGGNKMLMTFLQRNVKYPTKAVQNGAQARATVTFVVDKDGKIKDVTSTGYDLISIGSKSFSRLSTTQQEEIKNEVRELFLTEAERVVKGMPKWEPGTKGGEPVSVKYNLPVTFRMVFSE